MEPIWKKHWPATVDEKSIRLPEELLTETLARQAKRVPDRAAIQFYGRAVTFAELDSAVGRFAGFLQAKLKLPVLAVGGQLDNGRLIAEMAHELAEHVHAEIVPGGGHWTPEESPQFLTERLLAFIRDHATPIKR